MKTSKKFLTGAMALTLTLTATMGTAFAAFSSSVTSNSTSSTSNASATLSGDSKLDTAAINVTVPTTLNFAVDPLELNEAGNGIACAPLKFTNAGDSAVKLSLSTTLSTSAGVTFAESADDIDTLDISSTDKNAYVGLVVTKDGSAYDTTNEKAVKTLGTTAATVDFLLADTSGTTSVKFFGKVTPGATWAASDITASVVYTITPISATVYDAYTNSSNTATYCAVADTQGLVSLPKKATATSTATSSYTAGDAIAITVTEGQKSDGTAIKFASLAFSADGGKTYTTIPATATAGANYTVSNGVITLPTTAPVIKNQFSTASTTRSIKVTYSDGTSTVLEISVQ